jgi:succinyl-CoA synthetase alpha subunit
MAVGLFDISKVLVQGVTGTEGSLHTGLCREYGTAIVAGVTPGKEGTTVHGVPVYNSVRKAKEIHDADVSLIFVPPLAAADAMLESINAGIRTIVCITEGIPIHDMMKVKRVAATYGTVLIGPNCPGIISPGMAKAGIMPGHIFRKGKVGMISRSGTLLYEAADQVVRAGLGISTALGIGGDPITGTDYTYWLERFEGDPDTEMILLIGEIGGNKEEEAAAFVAEHVTKPVCAFIAGRTAPTGRRMGHAGAIISGNSGTVHSKEEAFREAGITVIRHLSQIGTTVAEVRQKKISQARNI